MYHLTDSKLTFREIPFVKVDEELSKYGHALLSWISMSESKQMCVTVVRGTLWLIGYVQLNRVWFSGS